MLKIVADNKIPFLEGVLEPYADIRYLDGKAINRKDLSDADVLLIRTRTRCTRELLEGTNVRLIGTATIGYDHIDTAFCDSSSIKWKNAPGCNSSSVQQYVIAALLKIASEFRMDLKEKTIGIIGAGNVGSKIQKAAEIFGMKVLVNDPPRQRKEQQDLFTDMDTLLRESDIITLHVPLNFVGEDKTYHLVNSKTIKRIKKGAWLINTSRGEVVETGALKDALDKGRLSGAVVDVWEHEPDIDIDLMRKSFVATPHIAGYSTDGKANGTSIIVREVSAAINLPLKDWYPAELPAPKMQEIEIDCRGKEKNQILREAIFTTYNIDEDDLQLRFAPPDFEIQRGNYRIRREFPAFNLKLKSADKEIRDIFKKLGFRLV